MLNIRARVQLLVTKNSLAAMLLSLNDLEIVEIACGLSSNFSLASRMIALNGHQNAFRLSYSA